jgi:voltage-gated potassium channel
MMQNSGTTEERSVPRVDAPRRSARWSPRFTAAQLLIAIVLLIVASPFVEDLPGGEGIESVLMTVVLSSAVLVVGGRHRTLWLVALFAGPVIVGKWLYHFQPNLMPPAVYFAMATAFLVFVITHLLRFVLRAVRIDTEVLCASIAAYLMLGLLWALAYSLVAELIPNAFSFNAATISHHGMAGFNSFYFSFVTLSTVGYGDITPVARVARMLAAAEAMTGLLYVAVLVARLVSLYSAPSPRGNDVDSQNDDFLKR